MYKLLYQFISNFLAKKQVLFVCQNTVGEMVRKREKFGSIRTSF